MGWLPPAKRWASELLGKFGSIMIMHIIHDRPA